MSEFLNNINNIESVAFDKIRGVHNSYLLKFFDLFFSIVGICLTLPLMFIIAIVIKLDSKGPVFFFQERLGQYKKPFNLIKFRTMVVDAEKNGPVWANENDERVTKIGRFLRKTRLDEIPQLFNILKGDLSFVGPRPVTRYSAELLKQHNHEYDMRFLAKPGVTGWSQIYWSHKPSVEKQLKKLPYDLLYLNGFSIKDYFKILLLTIKVILTGKGV